MKKLFALFIFIILQNIAIAQTDLFQLVDDNNIKELRQVLAKGVNPDTLNKYKFTPLIKSILNDNFKTTKLLLKYGANPNVLYEKKYCYDLTENKKIKKALKKHGAISHVEFLHAFWNSDFEKINYLINRGIDVTLVNEDIPIYSSAFSIAVCVGDTNLVNIIRNNRKNRSLHYGNLFPITIACNHRKNTMMSYLFENGHFGVADKERWDTLVKYEENEYLINLFDKYRYGISYNLLATAIKYNNKEIADFCIKKELVTVSKEKIYRYLDSTINLDTSKMFFYVDSICKNKYLEFEDIPFSFGFFGRTNGSIDVSLLASHGKYDFIIDKDSEKFKSLFPNYKDTAFYFIPTGNIKKNLGFRGGYKKYLNNKYLYCNKFYFTLVDTLKNDTTIFLGGKTKGNLDVLVLKNQYKLDFVCLDTNLKVHSFNFQINNSEKITNNSDVFSEEVIQKIENIKHNDSLKITEITLINSENTQFNISDIKLRIDSIESLALTCLPNFKGKRWRIDRNTDFKGGKIEISNNYSNLKINSFELKVYWGDGFSPPYEKSNGEYFSEKQLEQIHNYFNRGRSNIYFRNIIVTTQAGDEIFLRNFILRPKRKTK